MERSFHEVLRAAVRDSGLGLERIRYRLAQRGYQVSAATLSLWQSGQRRPERRESLAALRVLEEVLGLSVGALTTALGPRRARGPGPGGQRRVDLTAIWPLDPEIPALLRQVDAEDEFLVRLSQHDLVRVGGDGVERSTVVRMVLRATRSGVSRLPVVYAVDGPDPGVPSVRPLRHCSVRSADYLPERGYLVASLEFDRELGRGDVIMVEYEIVPSATSPRSTRYVRKLRFPVHEYFAEVGFHPDALPARCRWVFTDDGVSSRGGELVLDGAHCVQFAVTDASPGNYAIQWDW